MKRIVTGLLCTLFLLSGCASKANYDKRIGSYKGESVDRVLADFGAPTSQYKKSDGTEILQYDESRRSSYTNTYHQLVTVEASCRTTFFIKDGVVQSFTTKGGLCKE